ncbi:MAG: dihydroorotate dehydrogenase electron transfer subunit [Christensenellales bacterium]|jgi:dihydroorotate dehydrogenase electron transfer subunit
MFKKVKAIVKENKEIAAQIYRMVLQCPDADLANFVPGQFANIAIPGHDELLLKRPISIGTADAGKQTVTLFYQIKGKGTNALSGVLSGAKIDAIMPVGRGFNLKIAEKRIFLVGGGMGIAPLLTVTKKWPDKSYEAFLGHKGKDYVYCLSDFELLCEKIFVTSDDGTIGEKGFITDLVKKRLNEKKPDVVLACGPPMMLRTLREIIKPYGIAAQASMEQRMGCGFGACATCACGVNTEDGPEYKKVCIEGPVFDLYEVML